jgi:hypothetical protein
MTNRRSVYLSDEIQKYYLIEVFNLHYFLTTDLETVPKFL